MKRSVNGTKLADLRRRGEVVYHSRTAKTAKGEAIRTFRLKSGIRLEREIKKH